MKKTLPIICSLLLFCTKQVYGQKADSLKNLLAKAKEDTVKVEILLAICDQQGDVSDQERAMYAGSAMALSEKLKYQKGTAGSHVALGIVCNSSGKYDEALKHLDTALQMLPKPGDQASTAKVYRCIGRSWHLKNDYPVALSWYLKSLRLYESLKKETEANEVMYDMSGLYHLSRNYAKAKELASRVAAFFTLRKDTLHLAMARAHLANIAFNQNQDDTALFYYEQALEITKELKNQSYAEVSLSGLGNVYFTMKKYDKAIFYHGKALEIARTIGNSYYIAYLLTNLGRDYSRVDKFGKAEALLKEAIDLSKKAGIKRVTCEAYYCLAATYELKKDYKNAMEYSFMYSELRDTLYNEENASLINDLTAKYETEKKEKAIALLHAELSDKQKQHDLLDAKVKEKNIIIASVAGGAILIFVSGFLFYSRQKLREKNKFQEELNEQQKSTANAIIQTQEEERNRIARELHDGVGTFLSTLKLNLQVLENNDTERKISSYKNNSELLDRTSEELRKITRGLSNELLQEKGLSPALRVLVQSIQSSGTINIQFLTDETDERYDTILESNYYRIAQELINNSIKHAKASKISLQLIDHDTEVLLMLEDNGSGFDSAKASTGMGLKNIRNRAEFLGGTFKMESVSGQGSTFIIEVPKKAA